MLRCLTAGARGRGAAFRGSAGFLAEPTLPEGARVELVAVRLAERHGGGAVFAGDVEGDLDVVGHGGEAAGHGALAHVGDALAGEGKRAAGFERRGDPASAPTVRASSPGSHSKSLRPGMGSAISARPVAISTGAEGGLI